MEQRRQIRRRIFKDIPEDYDEKSCHIAVLGGMADGAYDSRSVADAFKLAGDVLVKEVSTRSETYELVYPILYNYRHCLEVYLKAITGPKNGHHLRPLLDDLSRFTKAEYGLRLPRWVRVCILEFDEFDRQSTTFRFADNRVVSRVTGDSGEFLIDLPGLKKIMDTLQAGFHKILNERLEL